jgi:hypothetical protein
VPKVWAPYSNKYFEYCAMENRVKKTQFIICGVHFFPQMYLILDFYLTLDFHATAAVTGK